MLQSPSSTIVEKSKSKSQKPKPKPVNPIEAAINSWAEDLPPEFLTSLVLTLDHLISSAPKRWVVYTPMILLPSGSFGQEWDCLLTEDKFLEHRTRLWKLILENIGKKEGKGILTHLAINSGIPLHQTSTQEAENILRTPSGLITLYGNFGPSLPPSAQPTAKDFEEAFWVSTKQNGITQIWAPRYTMFSRGNIKEKARLLGFHRGRENEMSAEELAKSTAVDLYAGIGYFVFSYTKMGMRRVVGWELNPWSVEGLRRGAVANGWSVRVVGADEELDLGSENILVVLEDNRKAGERLRGLDVGGVKHVNCGLLPTSSDSWKMALEIVKGEGWLHLHENVGVADIPARKLEIESLFKDWLTALNDARTAKVEHVEFVKTFAPAVWHCVFDVCISTSQHE